MTTPRSLPSTSPHSTLASQPTTSDAAILKNIRDQRKPYLVDKLHHHLRNDQFKVALMERLETSSLSELINIAMEAGKLQLRAEDEPFRRKLALQLNNALNTMSVDDMLSLTSTELHYCYGNFYENIAARIGALNRENLQKLLHILSQDEKRNEKHSFLKSAVTLIAGDYSIAGMIRYVNSIYTQKSTQEMHDMQQHFMLQSFFHENTATSKESDVVFPEVDLNECKFDDSAFRTLFKQYSHTPTVLTGKLSALFKQTYTSNFQADTLISSVMNQFTQAGRHDLGAYFPFVTQEPSLCCFLSCISTVAEQEDNANTRQQDVLAHYTQLYSDTLITSPLPGFKQESVYIKPLLEKDDKINTAIKDSFFLSLLEREIYQQSLPPVVDETTLDKIYEAYSQCSQRLVTRYDEMHTILNDAILVIENEYKRLQRDPGNCFKTRGGHKAEVLYATLKDTAFHAANFLRNPSADIQTFRHGVHESVTRCLSNPVISQNRNTTADVLRGVLGAILFIPTLGATYWSNSLYDTFFGAPRVVSALMKSAQQTQDQKTVGSERKM